MAKLKAIGINEYNLSQQGEFTNVRQHEEAAIAMTEASVANEGVTYKIFKLSDTKKMVNTIWKVLMMFGIQRKKEWKGLDF